MANSVNLDLPYIAASQAQKHITHNEALKNLDIITQLAVIDKNLTSPPASPNNGDRYIIAPNATGAWLNNDNKIAAYIDGAWIFLSPNEGWIAWVSDEGKLYIFNDSIWAEVTGSGGGSGGGSSEIADKFGINTTADATNRLSVKSDAVLFSHDDITPGTGDIRAKINKDEITDTASFLFQSNFSGRSEIGLTGDNDFHFKVSPDGTNWFDGIIIDKDTGACSFPNSNITSTIKQMVSAKLSSTLAITSASDIPTGLKATLTPQNATNKILVRVITIIGGNFWNSVPKVSIYRKIGAANAIKVWPSIAGRYINHQYLADSPANSSLITYSCAMEFDDTPNTTQDVTYEVYLASNGIHNACLNSRNDGVPKGESFIILEEHI